jgi:hypothetical protein
VTSLPRGACQPGAQDIPARKCFGTEAAIAPTLAKKRAQARRAALDRVWGAGARLRANTRAVPEDLDFRSFLC